MSTHEERQARAQKYAGSYRPPASIDQFVEAIRKGYADGFSQGYSIAESDSVVKAADDPNHRALLEEAQQPPPAESGEEEPPELVEVVTGGRITKFRTIADAAVQIGLLHTIMAERRKREESQSQQPPPAWSDDPVGPMDGEESCNWCDDNGIVDLRWVKTWTDGQWYCRYGNGDNWRQCPSHWKFKPCLPPEPAEPAEPAEPEADCDGCTEQPEEARAALAESGAVKIGFDPAGPEGSYTVRTVVDRGPGQCKGRTEPEEDGDGCTEQL